MSERIVVQPKKATPATFTPPISTPLTRCSTPHPASAPVQATTEGRSSLQKMPLSNSQQETPDLQAQLDRAARFGHSFGRVQVHANTPATIQPKLTISQPGDEYEHEADRVADQVVAMSVPVGPQPSITPAIQRQTPDLQTQLDRATRKGHNFSRVKVQANTPEAIQPKLTIGQLGDSPAFQRQTIEDLEGQEKQVQTQQQRAVQAGRSPSRSLESRLSAQKGGGNPLSDEVRAFMEPRFDVDFSQVRVHTDSESVQMNRELNAQAFAHGRDIYFGAGKYNPGSSDGKHLLAHELTHVVQQTGGAQRKPTVEHLGHMGMSKIIRKPLANSITPIGENSSHIQGGWLKKAWNKVKSVASKVGGALLDFVPGAKQLKAMLSRVSSLIGPILKNPGGFLKNLFKGVKAGFMGFVGKIGRYLENGLKTWLFGALGNSIKLPKSFDLKGIFEMLLQMAGVSYGNIRERAAKNFGEEKVSFLEQGVEAAKGGKLQEFALGQAQGYARGQAEASLGKENTALVEQGVQAASGGQLAEFAGAQAAQRFDAGKAGPMMEAVNLFGAIKRGPAGIMDYFKTLDLSSLKDMVLGQVKEYLMQQIIMKAILRITAYLVPGAGWALAAFDIIKIGKFFIERAQKLKELIDAFFESMHDAAGNAVNSAARKIEGALAASVPVLIDFLADYLGIGGLAKKVRGFIAKASGFVNKHIIGNVDMVVNKVMSFLPELPSWMGNKKDGAANNAASSQNVTSQTAMSNSASYLPGHEGSQGKSSNVHDMVGNFIASKVQQPFENLAAAQTMLRQVFPIFQPMGLKSLNFKKADQEGTTYDVIATASPPMKVAAVQVKNINMQQRTDEQSRQSRGKAKTEPTAQALINQYKNFFGLNLSEEKLAQDLLNRLPSQSDLVIKVFRILNRVDRDDVGYFLLKNASDSQIIKFAADSGGRRVLALIAAELADGGTFTDERKQVSRVVNLAESVSINTGNEKQNQETEKVEVITFLVGGHLDYAGIVLAGGSKGHTAISIGNNLYTFEDPTVGWLKGKNKGEYLKYNQEEYYGSHGRDGIGQVLNLDKKDAFTVKKELDAAQGRIYALSGDICTDATAEALRKVLPNLKAGWNPQRFVGYLDNTGKVKSVRFYPKK